MPDPQVISPSYVSSGGGGGGANTLTASAATTPTAARLLDILKACVCVCVYESLSASLIECVFPELSYPLS